ncbi:MAG: protein translocase subunit SecD [Minisyncoccia bacterium]
MFKNRILALILLLAGFGIGWFVYQTERGESAFSFKLGLDLNGGTELVYSPIISTSTVVADLSAAMNSLRDVIDRRVNAFGVAEPVVQIEKVGLVGGDSNNQRLIVELPGVTNVDKAVAMIGETPILEFRLENEALATSIRNGSTTLASTTMDQLFLMTGLTGRLLDKASLDFDSQTGQAVVALQFNTEGADLFAKITKENVGKSLAIFLDGDLKSTPTIKEEIRGGKATISGGFVGTKGREEAKKLVDNLNLGSLPIPIELISTQSVGATLGQTATMAAVKAGILAFIIISIFLIVWYRLPGLLAVTALSIYVAISLAIFKLIPVTLTAAGIAGFILSVGMAVDANILIFERLKEELRRGRELGDAIKEGFARAWLSIRDSNTSSLITAVILFMFSSTSIVKGFALVFGIGVLVSMFTAITGSRTLLMAIQKQSSGKIMKFLFSNGFSK